MHWVWVDKALGLFKVFRQYSLDWDVVVFNSHFLEAYGNNVINKGLVDKETTSANHGILPQIVIATEKVFLTIVHELFVCFLYWKLS